jgi:hypothetical protein
MLYLVLNVEDPREKWVLDICTDLEKAEQLKDQYCNNFKKNSSYYYDCNIIEIEPVEITDEKVIWSYDKEENYD